MPGRPPYENEVVKKWTAEIARSDGFIFVTPEYNYGPSASPKNALDWVYPEWNRKAAAFVSYGSAMGARGVQELRLTAIELQLAPVRSPSIFQSRPFGALPGRRCGRGPSGAEASAKTRSTTCCGGPRRKGGALDRLLSGFGHQY